MYNANNLKAQAVEVVPMTQAEREELEKLRIENAKLKAAQHTGSIRVTEKGGIAVYGLGRFPVTLYKSQWEKLLGMAEQIRTFIEANSDKLSEKPTKAKAEVEEQVA